MRTLLQIENIFLKGMLISIIGSLPLGSLNITAFQFAADSVVAALVFAIGAVFAELMIVRIMLMGSGWLHRKNTWITYLTPVAVVILLSLATYSFYQSQSHHLFHPQASIGTIASFVLGITLSACNPLQIPFWLGWNEVVFFRHATTVKQNRTRYIAGIGVGTFIVFAVFILTGNFFSHYFQAIQVYTSYGLGIVYTLLALWLIARFVQIRKTQTI
ncbi:MAG: LysE family transporter [Flavobacteriales bacterium]